MEMVFGWLRGKKRDSSRELPDLPVSRRSEPDWADDVVLRAYLDLFERAKEAEDLQKMAQYAAAIDERQRFLERQMRARRARAVQLSRSGAIEPENGAESGGKVAIPAIDIANLAPHAGEIANAVVDSFADMIPGPLRGTIAGAIRNAIEKHPDMVKKLFDKLMSFVNTSAPGSGESPGAPPSRSGWVILGTNYDPTRPETWARELVPEMIE
ncbi:MAG: hypothetical protein RXR82_06060 [Nitrososphaeria archaeon]